MYTIESSFMLSDAEDAGSDTITVELEKNAGGVGFSLEGGKGSIHGDKPLVINRIFKGKLLEGNAALLVNCRINLHHYPEKQSMDTEVTRESSASLCTSK